MKTHTRDYVNKYEGVNPLERLHAGEPFFFIRAQDKLGPEAVQAYAHLLKRESERAFRDGNEELSNELLKQSLAVLHVSSGFNDWQVENPEKVKTPDGTKIKDRAAPPREEPGK